MREKCYRFVSRVIDLLIGLDVVFVICLASADLDKIGSVLSYLGILGAAVFAGALLVVLHMFFGGD